jgi:DNA-binding NarL/FixJ family response regulator
MTICRILIVDDHELIRRNIRALIDSRDDWSVCGEAKDGLEGVAQARTLRPDLVIMDVSMPKMNGIDATRIIRKDARESRILIISQNDPAVVCQQTADADADGFLAKCDIPDRLIEAVERMFCADGQRKAGKAS